MKFAVVLVEPEYQMNIGFVARVMKNFGVRELILVNPPELTGEAYKFAMHAKDVLENAKIVTTLDEALKMVDVAVGTTGVSGKVYLPERTPISPEEFAKRSFLYSGKIGIFFGRESKGLSNDELEKMDFTVTIPTSEEYPIMNLSHAVAVVLYEVYKQKIKAETSTEENRHLRKATREEKDILVRYWSELLETLNYPKDPIRRKYYTIMFRRVIGRSFIYAREIYSLYGPLRLAMEKIKRCENDKH